jgi:hypothetical protein
MCRLIDMPIASETAAIASGCGSPAAEGTLTLQPGASPQAKEEFPSFRLKVVNLPPDFDAEALRTMFGVVGTVHAPRVVVKCRVVDGVGRSGSAAAYGYIGFSTKQEADSAIQMFDDQVRLPGAPGNLGVYYAKPPQFKGRQEPADSGDYNKLYFSAFNSSDVDAQLSAPNASTFMRRRLLALFGQHGRVRQLQLYKSGRGAGDHGGSTRLVTGTVTMFTATEAVNVLLEYNKCRADGEVLAEPQDVQVSLHGSATPECLLVTSFCSMTSFFGRCLA